MAKKTINPITSPVNQVVEKTKVSAVIQTVTQRIVGQIHIRSWERVKDSFNNLDDRFIAITNAKVYNFNGQVIHRAKFLAINVDHLVWINPDDSEQLESRVNGDRMKDVLKQPSNNGKNSLKEQG